MSPNVQFILDIAAGMGAASVPVGASLIAVVWRSARKLDRNTDAVTGLISKIDGTIVKPGIEARLERLEADKIRRDAIAEARAQDQQSG